MHITVAICTWNRAKLLDQTLNRMQELIIPEGVSWELLVVNNNCTDETESVLDRYQTKFPLRRFIEYKQGQSNARNRAIQEAQGELILWTDDDVLVSPHWIANYVLAAKKYPEVSFFGGPIRPWFLVKPPRWLEKYHSVIGWPWALLELGETDRLLTTEEFVYGANMAFRTEIHRRFPFDASRGHIGTGISGGDETDLQRGLYKAGHSGMWLAMNSLLHFVPPERMTLDYLRRRAIANGSTLQRTNNSTSPKTWFGVPRWIYREYLQQKVQTILFAPFRNRIWFRSFIRASVLRGVIQNYRQAYQNRRIEVSS